MDPQRTAVAADSPAAGGTTAAELSDRDREILEFERQWWKYGKGRQGFPEGVAKTIALVRMVRVQRPP